MPIPGMAVYQTGFNDCQGNAITLSSPQRRRKIDDLGDMINVQLGHKNRARHLARLSINLSFRLKQTAEAAFAQTRPIFVFVQFNFVTTDA